MRLFAFAISLALAAAQEESAVAGGSCDCSAAEGKAAALSEQLAKAQAEVQKLRSEIEAYKSSQQEQMKKVVAELETTKSASKKVVAELETTKSASKKERHDLSQQLQQCSQGAELSVLGVVSKTGSIANDVIQHLLKQTTLDDQVLDAVSGHVGTAKDFTVDVMGKLASVDYNEYVMNLTQHEVYVAHVKPAMGKVAEGAQPYVDLYVSPALETAKVYTNPALASAKETYATAAKTMEADVLPALKRSSNQAMSEVPRLWSLGKAYLDVALEPVFGILSKAAPKHAKALPSSPVDRLLALLCLLAVSYYTVRVSLVLARLSLRFTRHLLWLTFLFVLRLPLLLARKALAYSFWMATGFYCCGLCRRRGSKAKKAEPAVTNGKTAAKTEKATVAELTKLLEASKKKGTLDQAVKLLAGMAGSGKPMNNGGFPDSVKGKVLEKDSLKKALGKFKEVDMKKLGL